MQISKIISALLLLSISLNVYSEEQENHQTINPEQIVNDIINGSNSNVTIEMSNNLYDLLVPIKKEKKIVNRNGTYRTMGYRIQVFSDGRNQHTLEARANARGNAVLSRFPKYKGQVYIVSKSPNWFTRIGNFETMEDANSALKELKRAFPSFSGEMRIVKCEVLIRK